VRSYTTQPRTFPRQRTTFVPIEQLTDETDIGVGNTCSPYTKAC
jgi:hypothetical protein